MLVWSMWDMTYGYDCIIQFVIVWSYSINFLPSIIKLTVRNLLLLLINIKQIIVVFNYIQQVVIVFDMINGAVNIYWLYANQLDVINNVFQQHIIVLISSIKLENLNLCMLVGKTFMSHPTNLQKFHNPKGWSLHSHSRTSMINYPC